MADISERNDSYSLAELSDTRIRYEQIGNVIYMMANPSEFHEAILMEIGKQLGNYLDNKPCTVYGSNLGLDLKDFIPKLKTLTFFQEYFKKKIDGGQEEHVYLLPDIQVLCDIDRTKFSSRGYQKAPKMIVEIFSPSTGGNDLSLKKEIYEAIGVEEYWVVIDIQNVVVFKLKNGRYIQENHSTEEDSLEVPVTVFSDLVMHLKKNKFGA